MSEIGNGIKQPLRWYDDIDKQNINLQWIADGGSGTSKVETVIVTQNAFIPFQIRRRHSSRPVTEFKLFSLVGGTFIYTLDVLSVIPAPTTNHLKIIQMGAVDNIVWYPLAELTMDIHCGLHYLYLTDGINEWWSEIFRVVEDFEDMPVNSIAILEDYTVQSNDIVSKDGTPGGIIVTTNKPF